MSTIGTEKEGVTEQLAENAPRAESSVLNDTPRPAGEADLHRYPMTPKAYAFSKAPATGRFPVRSYLNGEQLTKLAFCIGRQLTFADLNLLFRDDGPMAICGSPKNDSGCGKSFQPVAVTVLSEEALDAKASERQTATEMVADVAKFGDLAPYIATYRDADGEAVVIEAGSSIPTPELDAAGKQIGWLRTCFCGGIWWWSTQQNRVLENYHGCLALMRKAAAASRQSGHCYSLSSMERVIAARERKHQENLAEGIKRQADEVRALKVFGRGGTKIGDVPLEGSGNGRPFRSFKPGTDGGDRKRNFRREA